MPDVKKILTDEIRRIARKEIKTVIDEFNAKIKKQSEIIKALRNEVVLLGKAGDKNNSGSAAAPDAKSKKTRAASGFTSARIAKLRARLHLSQSRFAVLLGVNQFTVSHYEKGKTCPRQETVEKLKELSACGKREIKRKLLEIDSASAVKAKKSASEN